MKRTLALLIGLGLAVAQAGVLGFRFNLTRKMVLATQGDVVSLQREGIRLNGEPVPNSRVVERDTHGRAIEHHPWGSYRLGPGELWLFSDRPNAYDSRYFGPVHEEHVVAVLQPWWVRR